MTFLPTLVLLKLRLKLIWVEILTTIFHPAPGPLSTSIQRKNSANMSYVCWARVDRKKRTPVYMHASVCRHSLQSTKYTCLVHVSVHTVPLLYVARAMAWERGICPARSNYRIYSKLYIYIGTLMALIILITLITLIRVSRETKMVLCTPNTQEFVKSTVPDIKG